MPEDDFDNSDVELVDDEVRPAVVDDDEDEVEVAKPVKYTPPSEDEWKTHQEKLKKANAEAKKYRLTANELKAQNESEAERAVREAVEKTESAVTGRYEPLIKRQALRTALVEAGCLVKPDKAMRLIDLDELDVDLDTGQVDGVTDAVRAFKRENPDLFSKQNGSRINASDRDDRAGGSALSALEQAVKKAGY